MSKLLMISGDTIFAAGRRGAFYNTLEEFHKHWEKIDIICPRVVGHQEKSFDFKNVFVHSSPWPKILQPLWILKSGLNIYKLEKFDIITVHEYPPFYNGLGAWLVWLRLRVPYILELMHVPGSPRAASLKEYFYKLLTRLFFGIDARAAKAVRVINKEIFEFLKSLGVREEKIKLIPAFYLDLAIFKPLHLSKKYDLIFIGRLEKNKGLDILIDVARKSDLRILIVGTGSLYNSLKMEIEKWKLKIDLHGFAKDSSEIAELINQSRALAMLSYNEGGPRVILEALACGAPVIATNVGIASEVINDRNGRIIGWSAEEVIKAFEEIKDLAPFSDLARFDRDLAIKNYADKIKELI